MESQKFFSSYEEFIEQMNSWKELLGTVIEDDLMQSIYQTLQEEYNNNVVYPPKDCIFNVFKQLSIPDIKVIIIGQDPYIKKDQAVGLSFSIPKTTQPVPPSLKNIYKAIKQNYPDFQIPNHGDLSRWVQQGIFLLNTTLTVRQNQSNSHANIGWQDFTNSIIEHISECSEKKIFVLWGAFAQKKASLIDKKKHLILQFSHPSPLCTKPFDTCDHFKLINEYLKENGMEEIDWQI